jgi:hypothetical protein
MSSLSSLNKLLTHWLEMCGTNPERIVVLNFEISLNANASYSSNAKQEATDPPNPFPSIP